jgi:streptogrisin D
MRLRNAVFTLGVGVAAAVLAVTPVQAVPSRSADPAASAGQQDLARLATTLEGRLGDRTAGSYVDEATGKLTITVIDAADAAAVRAAGAIPRTVVRSGAA